MTIDTKELRKLAEAATPQNFDTAQEKIENGYIECPHCGGSGEVQLEADYCNYDGAALGVQFYGIGGEFGAAEAFYRAANPATILALLDELADLQDLKAYATLPLRERCAEKKQLKAENEKLRKIISDSATACGAAVSVECSLEFMAMLPGEIGLVVNRLKSQVTTLQAEPNSYQSGFDAGRRSSAVYAQSHRNEALAVSAKNVELRAENEALRKDAERYRWLRDSEYAGKILRDMGAKYREDADEKIDASMAKEAGHD
ncbi:hypothetical protein ASF84_05335 [Pseudomonas sp. Leaf127]|uniref:hypothetical protein n=1 Tax=Pseudomonas sp. Leaf127 TaxID=1736267 RepID=UPI0007030E26|nr:hypothetical protein [Pseudomonas sp. Leaf127]KQQ60132.1 hypothetical protein ASF84_05335 [Pseudomonas sp. Leaf127]